MSENQNSRVYSIVVTALLILSAILGYFFWQKSRNMISESQDRQATLDSLTLIKANIEGELDSLSMAYSNLRTENESLQGKVTNTAAIIQQKEIAIKQIKATSTKNLDELRKQVADLQKAKTEYETIILVLRQENDQLKDENARLTGENEQLKGERAQLSGQVTDLAKQLEDQIRKTQSATFKATSFRVEVERRNDKLTTKARRARELLVSFDLADVPQTFQGAQKIYLVITDDKGNPIAAKNPVKATVYAPTGPVEIMAQQVKQVVIESTQRMSFAHQLEDKLKSGNYVVAIYCDKGLLGASSFRVS
jgi:peptidoglycan hydrolase CwlO-like protein